MFLVADTRLYTLPCRSVGRSVGPSVHHIFEFRAVFALLLLPNRPRLDCRVSGLVFKYIHFLTFLFLFKDNRNQFVFLGLISSNFKVCLLLKQKKVNEYVSCVFDNIPSLCASDSKTGCYSFIFLLS